MQYIFVSVIDLKLIGKQMIIYSPKLTVIK